MGSQYCCTTYAVGCDSSPAEDLYECKGDESWETWDTNKQRWCCVRESTACEPWDCNLDHGSWEDKWGDAKKEYCCHSAGKGCPALDRLEYDCHAGKESWELWENERKRYCCTLTKGTPDEVACGEFDCNLGRDAWEDSWSDVKREYCCEA